MSADSSKCSCTSVSCHLSSIPRQNVEFEQNWWKSARELLARPSNRPVSEPLSSSPAVRICCPALHLELTFRCDNSAYPPLQTPVCFQGIGSSQTLWHHWWEGSLCFDRVSARSLTRPSIRHQILTWGAGDCRDIWTDRSPWSPVSCRELHIPPCYQNEMKFSTKWYDFLFNLIFWGN